MKLHSLRRDDHGATAIEYGVIAALIGLGLVAALTSMRGSLNQDYGCIATSVGGGTPTCGTPPAPTTAAGWAAQMVPSNRKITGLTAIQSWFGYGGDASAVGTNHSLNVQIGGNYYVLNGYVVTPNVMQVSNPNNAPLGSAAGNITYAVVSPNGWIMVDTQPAQ